MLVRQRTQQAGREWEVRYMGSHVLHLLRPCLDSMTHIGHVSAYLLDKRVWRCPGRMKL